MLAMGLLAASSGGGMSTTDPSETGSASRMRSRSVRPMSDKTRQVLGTLPHELLHSWQEHHDRRGKRNHHNKAFRERAEWLRARTCYQSTSTTKRENKSF